MVEMSKKKVGKWKWVKVGENPKMPYPQCGRSIKTYSQTRMMPPLVSQSMGFLSGGVFAQRAHNANYYGDYPGNNPENHAPAESCTINSKLKNSNI